MSISRARQHSRPCSSRSGLKSRPSRSRRQTGRRRIRCGRWPRPTAPTRSGEGMDMTATQFHQLGDGTLAYDDEGEGPLIVTTPAMLDLRSELRLLVPLLVDAGFRVVSIDQRGMGESSGRWPTYGSSPM